MLVYCACAVLSKIEEELLHTTTTLGILLQIAKQLSRLLGILLPNCSANHALHAMIDLGQHISNLACMSRAKASCHISIVSSTIVIDLICM